MQPGVVDKKPVKITVGGQTLTVLVAGDPGEVLRLASEIDEMMSRISARAGHVDTLRSAILTCMHLADRAHTLEREMEEIHRRIEEKAQAFAVILDEALGK